VCDSLTHFMSSFSSWTRGSLPIWMLRCSLHLQAWSFCNRINQDGMWYSLMLSDCRARHLLCCTLQGHFGWHQLAGRCSCGRCLITSVVPSRPSTHLAYSISSGSWSTTSSRLSHPPSQAENLLAETSDCSRLEDAHIGAHQWST
jgi:hypothetical protein